MEANCGGFDLSLEGVKIMGCKWDLYEFRIGRMRATRRVQSWYAIVLVESLPVGRSWPNSYRVAELCRGIDYAAYNIGFIRGPSCSPDLFSLPATTDPLRYVSLIFSFYRGILLISRQFPLLPETRFSIDGKSGGV